MRRTRMNTEKFDGAPLFAGLKARQLAPIAAHADRLTIEAGRVLSRAGSTALELVVILDGIAIEAGGEHGWVSLGPGTALAPEAVAARGDFPATVTADRRSAPRSASTRSSPGGWPRGASTRRASRLERPSVRADPARQTARSS